MQKSTADLRGDIMDALVETNRYESEFIGINAMPTWDVMRQAGTFAKLDADNVIAKVGGSKVAPGAAFDRDQRKPTTDSYSTVKYGGEEPIPIEDEAELDNYFDVEMDTASALIAKARQDRESEYASILFDDTTTFSDYKTDGSAWATASSGTPIDDIRDAICEIREQLKGFVGGARLVALTSCGTLNDALATDQVREALNYGGNGFDTRDAAKAKLASAVGLDAIYDSVVKNAAGTAIWTANKFGIYVVSDGNTLRSTPQVGRTVNWMAPGAYEGADRDVSDMDGIIVQSYFEEQVESLIVRVKRYQQVKLLNARAGHILYGLGA